MEGKKEFMIIRQRIVKIQARVRGYQLRKNYRKVVWSVGIVEKVILRRRRERPGLRVPEKLLVGPSKINLQRQKMNTISCRMAEGRLKPDYREHLPGCILWLNIQKQENNTIGLQLVLLKCSSPGWQNATSPAGSTLLMNGMLIVMWIHYGLEYGTWSTEWRVSLRRTTTSANRCNARGATRRS